MVINKHPKKHNIYPSSDLPFVYLILCNFLWNKVPKGAIPSPNIIVKQAIAY